MNRYSIGVDLGGTNLRAAAVNDQGAMLEKISGSTPLGEGPEAAVADIVRSVNTLRKTHGEENFAGIACQRSDPRNHPERFISKVSPLGP